MGQIFMLLVLSEATGCGVSGTWCDPSETPKLKREGLEQSSEAEGRHSSGPKERIGSSILFIPLLSSSFEISH